MEEILTKIEELHQMLKQAAMTNIQNDLEIPQHILDAIKNIYKTKMDYRNATGR